MTTLLVTPFAPYRDGIAAYATQELRRLRDRGESVEVLSPHPSAARWHLPLGGPRGMAMLTAMAGDYDRVIIQFAPEMLFGRCRSATQRTAVWAGLAALARRAPLDIRLHEVEYGPLHQNPLERRAAALALGQADRVTVHTEAERDALNELVDLGRRVEIVAHGRDFLPAVVRSRSEARAELGLAEERFEFLAIGFLQHH
ncbi:MAG: glycosyltransferase, partial [Actinomycetota bacterium]